MNLRSVRPSTPALSPRDRVLYILWFVGGLAIFLLVLFGLATLRREIAFSDPQVVALNADPTLVLMLPLAFFLVFFLVVRPARMFQAGQPLFSQKDSTREPQIEVDPRQKMKPLLLGALFVLLVALALLGLCRRTCVNVDASIRSYNVLNQETAFWPGEDMEALSLRVFYKPGRNGEWIIEFTLTNSEGKSFVFDHRGTKDSDFQGLLQVQSCFEPSQIRVDGVEYLEQALEEENFNEEQCQLLYQLFEVD